MKSILMSSLLFLMILLNKVLYSQNIESSQLLKLGLILELDGFELTHEVDFNYLNKGQKKEYSLILMRNTKYVIFATCDRDCGDIDLFLFDKRGNKIAYSDDTSDKPIMLYQPSQTQLYTIVVFMYDCSINPCRYGLAVYGK